MMQPHFGNTVVYAGADIEDGGAAMILVHGRNAAPRTFSTSSLVSIGRPARRHCSAAGGRHVVSVQLHRSARAKTNRGITSGLVLLESLVSGLIARGIAVQRLPAARLFRKARV